MNECTVEDCDRRHVAKGYCKMHYYRLRRTGTLDERSPRVVTRRTNRTHPAPTPLDTPCRLWQGAVRDGDTGYGRKSIPGRGTVFVHRWVMEQVYGIDAIADLLVMHLCDNPLCYRFDHLRLGTHSDNSKDMVAKGRNRGFIVGSVPQLKLSADDVRELRRRYGCGERQADLADAFSVDRSTVSKIVNNRARRTV